MTYFKDQICAASTKLEKNYRQMDTEESNRFRLRIEGMAATKRWPLWEFAAEVTAIQNPNGWKLIGEFLESEPGFLYLNPDDEKAIFRFENAKDIVDVIADCTGFEFYVSDENPNYFLCFNHHNFLIAAGTARKWLQNQATRS